MDSRRPTLVDPSRRVEHRVNMAADRDRLPMVLRTYVEPKGRKAAKKARPRETPALPPSDWKLIWDSETTTDPSQHRRVLAYQLRQRGQHRETGLAYEPDSLTDDEMVLVKAHATARGYRCMTVDDFSRDVFIRYVYGLGALNVLFNQEFDVTRLANALPGTARGSFAGGFTFSVGGNLGGLSGGRTFSAKYDLHLRTKHLNRTMSFIDFALLRRQRAPRSLRKRGIVPAGRRGHFVDVATLARALTGSGHSLRSLAKYLGTPAQKTEADLGGPVTEQLLDYAVNDVEVTWECFCELEKLFDDTGLTKTAITEVYSEASLGKATLKELGVRPWSEVRSEVDPHSLARLMSTYYGGRSEVAIRRQMVPVMLLDATSMYPTVAVLMGTWKYVIAAPCRNRCSDRRRR
jgi:hypothetical protein